MSFVAVTLPVLGSVAGGVIGAEGSKDAAGEITAGNQSGIDEQARQFNVIRELLGPSIEAGDTSRSRLLSVLGLPGGDDSGDPMEIIRNTPGFQFQTEQGARALNAQRSAGRSSGGALIRDFARFNQGLASNFYQDYANRLANLAGTGQTAAINTGAFGTRTSANISSLLQNSGLARASGVLGQSNAFGNAINRIGGLFGDGGFGQIDESGSTGTSGGAGSGRIFI